MFSKLLSPFEKPKTNKSLFQSTPEHLPCFELNYKFLERHKKTSFALDNEKARKSCQHGPKNGKQMLNQTSGEATTGKVPGSVVTYTEEKINIFKDDMASGNTKLRVLEYLRTPIAIVVFRKVQNRADLEQHF